MTQARKRSLPCTRWRGEKGIRRGTAAGGVDGRGGGGESIPARIRKEEGVGEEKPVLLSQSLLVASSAAAAAAAAERVPSPGGASAV